MKQELTIFIVLVALIVTISTAVSSMIVSVRSPDPSGIVIFNGHPQLSSAIWVGGIVVFLIFALVGAFCFKVTK